MKMKTVKAWAVLKDNPKRSLAYWELWPRIYIQKAKPIVSKDGVDMRVVRCIITYNY